MLCPACQRKTIGFKEWCRHRNAFFWCCPWCGTLLKANRATWLGFWLGMAIMLLYLVPVLMFIFDNDVNPHGLAKGLAMIGLIVILLPVAYVAYRKGGYAIDE